MNSVRNRNDTSPEENTSDHSTMLKSPLEDEMEWRSVLHSLFGSDATLGSQNQAYNTTSTEHRPAHSAVAGLALATPGNTWGRSIYIPH